MLTTLPEVDMGFPERKIPGPKGRMRDSKNPAFAICLSISTFAWLTTWLVGPCELDVPAQTSCRSIVWCHEDAIRWTVFLPSN